MARSKKVVIILAAALLALPFAAALSEQGAQPPSSVNAIPGEKPDSGLGELPHYRQRAQHRSTRGVTAIVNRVPGEKLG